MAAMKKYPIPMVPGPTSVPMQIQNAYQNDFGSADMEPEFLELYNQTENNLQQILNTRNPIAILTGEGMLALWSALKSALLPGDPVLSLATGVFGYGVAEMAKAIGARVKIVGFPYNETLHDWERIEKAIIEFHPKMITVIHCETPSGTLNPLETLSELKVKHQVPLLYADMVASLGGTPVNVDEWQVDLALGGSQKVLSCPAEMSFVAVSPTAWEIIESVGYAGYDALLPFRHAQENFYFPYTPHWHGVNAIHTSTSLLLEEGLKNVFTRHTQVADFLREAAQRIGYELFPDPDAVPSPTVTALKVPENIPWQDLDRRFREQGLVVGGSYGPLTGKVFRLGHMGHQADMKLAHLAAEILEKTFPTDE
jgi:aspartate aminotransferase-like enzyme